MIYTQYCVIMKYFVYLFQHLRVPNPTLHNESGKQSEIDCGRDYSNWIGNNCVLSSILIFLWLCCILDRKYLDGVCVQKLHRLLGKIRQLFEDFLNKR